MARTLEIKAQRQRVVDEAEQMENMADYLEAGLILINVSEGRLAFYCNSCRGKFENVDNFIEHVIKEHNYKLQEAEMETLHDDECIILNSDSDDDEEKVRKEIRNTCDTLGTKGKVQRVQQDEDEYIVLSSESDSDVEEIRDEIRNERESLEINDKVKQIQQCVQIVGAIPVDQGRKVNQSSRVQKSKFYSRFNNTHYVNKVVGSNARKLQKLNDNPGIGIQDGSYRESQIVGTNHQGTQDDLVQRVVTKLFKNFTNKV